MSWGRGYSSSMTMMPFRYATVKLLADCGLRNRQKRKITGKALEILEDKKQLDLAG